MDESSTNSVPLLDLAVAPTEEHQLAAHDPILSTSSAPPLSKNAQKRLLKQQAHEAAKPARRARERAMKKEKAAEKRKLVALGVVERPVGKKALIRGPKVPFGARVVLDLGFDELMNEKEVKSMGSQISYCYSAHRVAAAPVELLVTSLNGKLRERLDTKQAAYTSWRRVEWWEEPYDGLWSLSSSDAKVSIGAMKGQPKSRCAKEDVVYLTGDSPNVLEKFEEGKTYILGGLVDHNRHKSLCFDKAVAQGVQHAQLPIAEFLPEMLTRKILTVNQVFEIIVKWTELRDWAAALKAVMPARKLEPLGYRNRKGGADGEAGTEGSGAEDGGGDEEEENATENGKDNGERKEGESPQQATEDELK